MTKDLLDNDQRETVNKAKELFNDFFNTEYEGFDPWEKGRFEGTLQNLFDLIDDLFPEPKPTEPQKLYGVRNKRDNRFVASFTSIDKAEHFISEWATDDEVFEIVPFVEEKV